MIGYAIAIWMAPIMLRSFALTTREVGFYLGLAFVLGGIPGPILGGVLGEWLSHRDVRWFAWIPGLAGILCLPPLWLSLSATTFWPFLGLFALAYGIFLTSQAPKQCSALRAWVRRRFGNAAQQFSGPGVERGHNRAAERFLAPDLRRFCAQPGGHGGLPCGRDYWLRRLRLDSPADASLTIAPVMSQQGFEHDRGDTPKGKCGPPA